MMPTSLFSPAHVLALCMGAVECPATPLSWAMTSTRKVPPRVLRCGQPSTHERKDVLEQIPLLLVTSRSNAFPQSYLLQAGLWTNVFSSLWTHHHGQCLDCLVTDGMARCSHGAGRQDRPPRRRWCLG